MCQNDPHSHFKDMQQHNEVSYLPQGSIGINLEHIRSPVVINFTWTNKDQSCANSHHWSLSPLLGVRAGSKFPGHSKERERERERASEPNRKRCRKRQKSTRGRERERRRHSEKQKAGDGETSGREHCNIHFRRRRRLVTLPNVELTGCK